MSRTAGGPRGPVVVFPGLRFSRQPRAAHPVVQDRPHRPVPHPEAAGLDQLVSPGAVCLDVGAGCTRCTEALRNLAGPDGQVHRLAPGRPDRARRADTVDDLCRRENLDRVDFMRVQFGEDERDVLLGAFTTLLRDQPTLLLRWGRRRPDRLRTAETVRSLTVSLSYTMHGWQEGNWRPVTDSVRGWGGFLFRPQPLPRRLP
ncbi:hypothetical protein ACWEGQ_33845 [Streptomyces seoulensis]